MTARLIIKHLIVEKCGRISYRTYTTCIMHKTLEIFGVQQTFSTKVYKEGKEWVNGSKFGFYIFKNV